MGRESGIIDDVRKAVLRAYPKAVIVKNHGGPFSRRGVPDLMIIFEDTTVFIEMKARNNKPTWSQRNLIKLICANGVVAGAAWSVEGVKKLMEIALGDVHEYCTRTFFLDLKNDKLWSRKAWEGA